MDFDNFEYTVRIMTEKDINGVLELRAFLGYYDSASFLSIMMICDPNAFYVAVRNDDKKIIGVCASPVTSHSTGFFGMYGVLKDCQQKGIGTKLADSCLKHIGERNASLFTVDYMEPKYEKLGFRIKNGISLVVVKGFPQNIEHLCHKIDKNINIIQFNTESNQELMNKIILYDIKVLIDNRQNLIRLTVQNENHYTLIALNSDDNVVGFGCIKANCNDQKVIGPVYADNDSIAEALILRLASYVRLSKHNYLCLFTLNYSIGCRNLCQKLEMKEHSNHNLLYTKFSPPINYQFIHCVNSNLSL